MIHAGKDSTTDLARTAVESVNSAEINEEARWTAPPLPGLEHPFKVSPTKCIVPAPSYDVRLQFGEDAMKSENSGLE
jgi:hypothetical protein